MDNVLSNHPDLLTFINRNLIMREIATQNYAVQMTPSTPFKDYRVLIGEKTDDWSARELLCGICRNKVEFAKHIVDEEMVNHFLDNDVCDDCGSKDTWTSITSYREYAGAGEQTDIQVHCYKCNPIKMKH